MGSNERAAPLQDTVFKLTANGMTCAALSGDMDKAQRQNTLRRFQQGDFRALVVRWNSAHPCIWRPAILL